MEAKIKVRHMGGKETFYTMDLLSATVQDLKQKTFRRDNIKVQCQQLTNLTTVSPQVLEGEAYAFPTISTTVDLNVLILSR